MPQHLPLNLAASLSLFSDCFLWGCTWRSMACELLQPIRLCVRRVCAQLLESFAPSVPSPLSLLPLPKTQPWPLPLWQPCPPIAPIPSQLLGPVDLLQCWPQPSSPWHASCLLGCLRWGACTRGWFQSNSSLPDEHKHTKAERHSNARGAGQILPRADTPRLRVRDLPLHGFDRSKERRVGKECRSRWSPYH